MGRSPCCEKAHTNKGAWTKEEDHRLISYIRSHGEGCWRSLPKAAATQPWRGPTNPPPAQHLRRLRNRHRRCSKGYLPGLQKRNPDGGVFERRHEMQQRDDDRGASALETATVVQSRFVHGPIAAACSRTRCTLHFQLRGVGAVVRFYDGADDGVAAGMLVLAIGMSPKWHHVSQMS
ncbi:hypothetical protein DM860_013669 [Cuscuta australis]|uniref:Uncharacterized protein n=1 Tax=Cuscuta australis TaxID=267555 RepID=A0A328EEH3_9ASTE|nr:hypothetical protein DM860_013669 [Cuscuta australis]